MENQKLVTDTKLAARLGVRAAWLRSEAAAGRLPAVAAGTHWLFDAELVERLLLRRARATGAEPLPGDGDGGAL